MWNDRRRRVQTTSDPDRGLQEEEEKVRWTDAWSAIERSCMIHFVTIVRGSRYSIVVPYTNINAKTKQIMHEHLIARPFIEYLLHLR